MSKEIAVANSDSFTSLDAKTQESLVVDGNLRALTPEQKVEYYIGLCNSIGLNPLVQPFMYIELNGKLVLYARAIAGDQLRLKYNLNVEVIEKRYTNEFASAEVRVVAPNGRSVTRSGIVYIGNAKGQEKANAMMKAEAKADRRATLAWCGLSFLDESEVADVKDAKVVDIKEAKSWMPTGDMGALSMPQVEPPRPIPPAIKLPVQNPVITKPEVK